MKKKLPSQEIPQTFFEDFFKKKGYALIAGVDEAGRGPLAGPVVAAACILPSSLSIEGIHDSKKLTPKERQRLYFLFAGHPKIYFGVGIVDQKRIDQINILQASLEAMGIAVNKLLMPPHFLLVDGQYLPNTKIPGEALIRGDSRSLSIASASIIAKYIRDQLMLSYHFKWPYYGFDRHKGYGTKSHLLALKKYGASPIHRLSFKPVLNI